MHLPHNTQRSYSGSNGCCVSWEAFITKQKGGAAKCSRPALIVPLGFIPAAQGKHDNACGEDQAERNAQLRFGKFAIEITFTQRNAG